MKPSMASRLFVVLPPYNAHESATRQSRRMPASVPPMIICCVLTGTSQDLNSDRYWLTTCSIPSRPASDPNTNLMNALSSLAGVAVFHSPCPDHQKNFLNSSSRALIFVNVEPLRSKKTFGFQRATSAAHSYSGLPQ